MRDLNQTIIKFDYDKNFKNVNVLFEKKNIVTKIEGSKKILEVIEKLNTKKEKKYFYHYIQLEDFDLKQQKTYLNFCISHQVI